MCGPSSAIGLAEHERALWPFLRERLREPGRLMGVQRAVLGDDVEVVLGSVQGEPLRPVAVLVNDWLRSHLHPYARELWHRPRRR